MGPDGVNTDSCAREACSDEIQYSQVRLASGFCLFVDFTMLLLSIEYTELLRMSSRWCCLLPLLSEKVLLIAGRVLLNFSC